MGAACLLFANCAPVLETARFPVSVSASAPRGPAEPNHEVTARLERALNDYRVSIGLEPIPRHRGLDQMARHHCEFMARNRGRFRLGSSNLSHFGFEERSLLAKRRYGMVACSENLAGGFIRGDLAAELAKAWTESSTHQFNLRHRWDATGLAVHVAEDGFVYATQIFGNRGGSAMAIPGEVRHF